MSYGHDEGPVYYREIQKNAYLKRIPNEASGSKLRPLGHKKPPLKPMWTLFCVHNGRSPYLEQYPLAECPATLAHKPVWRACLRTARHVTASVKPHAGLEYDFLIDTDHGPVRMIAPDWESMQDWVTSLRNKLHELRILSKGENVYCPAPAAPPPRAAARDPTSPLPPTPPVPPDRVPGIELTTPPRVPEDPPPPEEDRPEPEASAPEPVDISSWEDTGPSAVCLPSTSQEKVEPKKSVAKICGQNICLDDSILKRRDPESDEEFAEEEPPAQEYRQTLLVDGEGGDTDTQSEHRRSSNITVIQVCSKPPHSAGAVGRVFDFPPVQPGQSFVNIVNTEVNVNSENGYGTVFSDSDYGHLSLTTTVNLTDVRDEPVKLTDKSDVYERLCMASTSNEVTKIKKLERVRKSSLPNLECNDATYEYLYPSQNQNNRNTTVTISTDSQNGVSQSESPQNGPISQTTSSQNGLVSQTANSQNGPLSQTETSQNGPISQTENTQIGPVSQNGRELNSNEERGHTVTVGNVSFNSRVVRSNVERSHSQNAYDSAPRGRENVYRRVQNSSPRRDGKSEKTEAQAKPMWKRGLTELSLLTRLRGIGQGRRHHSPTGDGEDRSGTSPVKVVHRSRPEARVDSTRRRSSSLSNGQSPPTASAPGLVPLRRRQALALQAEQRRRAAIPASVPHHSPPVLAEYDKRVWIAWWGVGGVRCAGRAGDALAAVRAALPRDLPHARQLLKTAPTPTVDLLFHRVPLAKIYVLNKRDQESIGIKLDGECQIVSVEAGSAAARAGLPPPGKWAVTEVNNRPINLIKGGEEEMNRLSLHGTEVSVLIQPAPLVKKLRSAIKANKALISMR